ncbi:hypothetical protein BU24DRAFT_24130 [Aaosphaeria arxii CBS 175.79]|uniref:PH domain-containing protein n=1 Tax=Aaosphaeria arxii CBS 175.79 TaxID=1450172 RepID=A0A6A5Y7S3_9PLEO|nr:uncharacterized protein BU24DRAFT_24130 [Aaosphaeria arxii CBS 175.79]KAF2021625.1 hypothetical protein BU24DRAFT_24130 [Aaosphaeria arxii CBS 175.79]
MPGHADSSPADGTANTSSNTSRNAQRSQRHGNNNNSSNSSSSSSSDRTPPVYGYHNTFHTHAQIPVDSPPPNYACANSRQTLARLDSIARAERAATSLSIPSYSCTVEISALLSLKQELVSPFQIASDREWVDYYVVLQGTQLNLHRPKLPHLLSKNKNIVPGRLIRSYTLQHAEVGVAADFKKTALIPKSPFAHLVPTSARQKLYDTDPHLFEPVREHVIRLRLETEQFLMCAPTQLQMLDWVENLCAAIDISLPIEDRSEPRYRSLPRRTRRQRQVESSSRATGVDLDNLSNVEAGRRFIAEQERIFRQLYPHLAADAPAADRPIVQEVTEQAAASNPILDPETDDLDPDDARYPTARRTSSRDGDSDERPSSSVTTSDSQDPKSSPPHRHSHSQSLRYRRRCAPSLLASSPRVSDVVYSGGRRMRINVKERILTEYIPHPPRYDVHNFPKQTKTLAPAVEIVEPRPVPAPLVLERPVSPVRAISDNSFLSFDAAELAPTSTESTAVDSQDEADAIRSASSSAPPSPTVATQAKADAARRLTALGKRRSSDENAGNSGLSAVVFGVGLLV